MKISKLKLVNIKNTFGFDASLLAKLEEDLNLNNTESK